MDFPTNLSDYIERSLAAADRLSPEEIEVLRKKLQLLSLKEVLSPDDKNRMKNLRWLMRDHPALVGLLSMLLPLQGEGGLSGWKIGSRRFSGSGVGTSRTIQSAPPQRSQKRIWKPSWSLLSILKAGLQEVADDI